jgi:hypothetical protein
MSEQSVSLRSRAVYTRVTNLVAGSWAVLAFYLVTRSLLITHEWIACIPAPIPLLAVWATLERKRWGRLTLLGISLTALGLCVTAIGMAACLNAEGHTPAHYALWALALYARNPETLLTIVLLAIATGIWMRRTTVIAEFERNKKTVLVLGQRAIAGALVACWALMAICVPLAARERPDRPPSRFEMLFGHHTSVSSRSSRSAHIVSNR